MAIKAATPEQQIAVGNFICTAPSGDYKITGRVLTVTEVKGQRIHVNDMDGYPASFILVKSIAYVCDTKEEALSVKALSDAKYDAISAAVFEVEQRMDKEFQQKLDALIAGK